eukprot:TRINITY_DN58197_c0_g1_i1.p1 TRINITY_DN58197_c0_g1~~TRINITY_DN58197_c0_g1_i1.p1  ORF type:complete len:733 (+),score=238.04 TRINITY_DN58197_c0_g1_i1:52-2199(+)
MMPDLPVLSANGTRHCVVATRNFTLLANPLHASLFASERIVAELCVPAFCKAQDIVDAVGTYIPDDTTLTAYCDASSGSTVGTHSSLLAFFGLLCLFVLLAIMGSCCAQAPFKHLAQNAARQRSGMGTNSPSSRLTWAAASAAAAAATILHCWDMRRNFYRLLSGRRGGGRHGESSSRRDSQRHEAYLQSEHPSRDDPPEEGYRRENASWVDGLKFFAMLWAMLGQATFYLIHTALVSNPHSLLSSVGTFYTFPITSSYYAADLFLFFSGMLSVKTLLHDAAHHPRRYATYTSTAKAIGKRSLRRFLRFTCMLGVTLVAAWVAIPSVLGGRGGVQRYEHLPLVVDSCSKHWWRTLFLFDNWSYSDPDPVVTGQPLDGGNQTIRYVTHDGDAAVNCLFWSWPIAVDLQWSLVSPLLVLPYLWCPPQCVGPDKSVWLKAMPLASFAATAVVISLCVTHNALQGVHTVTGAFDMNFVSTLNRGSAYCMGILCQLTLHSIRVGVAPWGPLRLPTEDAEAVPLYYAPSIGAMSGLNDDPNLAMLSPPSAVVAGDVKSNRMVPPRVAALCTGLSLAIALQNIFLNWYFTAQGARAGEESGFFTLQRLSAGQRLYTVDFTLGFPLSLLLGSVSLTFAQRGVMHKFLDSTFFTPLSRLSLSISLLFPLAIVTSLAGTSTFYFSLSSFTSLYLAGLCGSLLPALIVYFIIEAPFLNVLALASLG